MALLSSNIVSKPWRRLRHQLCSASRVSFPYSTTSSSAAAVTSPSAAASDESLYQRISRCGNRTHSMIRVLDQWILEGRPVNRDELRYLVTHLKRIKRFKHALEVSEWYSSMNGVKLSPRDVFFHLDLVAKVRGIDHAEQYFKAMPHYFKPFSYKSLLNCYANAKCVEKSEALLQKMKDRGLARRAFPYNVMLRLYRRLGMYEKMDGIMREMEEGGIVFDDMTYSIRLSAFVDACDVEGMESLLMKMEVDPSYSINWRDCIIAANGFIKGGLVDKAIVMLRRAEQYANGMIKKYAYHYLITMYARLRYKDEVYRIWDLYRSGWKIKGQGYGCIVCSLILLGDLEGAEKIISESLSDTSFNFFPINLLARAYCENGDMEKAEELVHRAIGYGKIPQTNTWDILATGYYKNNQIEAAIGMMKKAGMAYKPGQQVNSSTFEACLQHLRSKGDSKEMEDFASLLSDKAYSSEVSSADQLDEEILRSDVNGRTEFDQIEDE